jgi:hypothetical protein
MTRPELMAIVLILLAVLLALLAVGWRRRARRQSSIAQPDVVPQDPGAVVGVFTGQYVSTTVSGAPLERIAVHGLGFRGNAHVTVTTLGAIVRIDGTSDKWIAATSMRGRRTATWTIDRVVEPNGLELLEWDLGGLLVDSYFRFESASGFDAAIDQLLERNPA